MYEGDPMTREAADLIELYAVALILVALLIWIGSLYTPGDWVPYLVRP